jgi:2-keto-4-pentenoate hydratase/2-oxohepta-3-ene-1,7-dioic acid hydratase in catechol pathway
MVALLPDAPWAGDMVELIVAGDEALKRVERALKAGAGRAMLDAKGLEILAPIPRPRKNIFCVGLNYVDHAEEGARAAGRPLTLPKNPVYFTKPPTGVIGPDAAIILDSDVTKELDYEAEFAVVIGKRGVNIPLSEAMEHVFGYTCLNDVSMRDLQRRHGQWFKGKAMDRGCPLGPWIVTADALPDPGNLAVTLRLNGKVMQTSNTSKFIFPVDRLVSDLSLGMSLEPGDIIATGTPGGVGFARTPPVFMADGDVVEVEIEGIGVLRNRVVAGSLR